MPCSEVCSYTDNILRSQLLRMMKHSSRYFVRLIVFVYLAATFSTRYIDACRGLTEREAMVTFSQNCAEN